MEDWEKKLDDFFEQQNQFEEIHKQRVATDTLARTETRKRAEEFIRRVVEPVFRRLADKLKQQERKVLIEGVDISRVLKVQFKGKTEFEFTVDIDLRAKMAAAFVKYKATSKSGHPLEEGSETIIENNRETDIKDITQTDILEHFTQNYTKTMRHRRTS